MTNLLLSRFETYLLDEDLQTESTEQLVEQEQPNDLENRDSYPAGFFTSL